MFWSIWTKGKKAGNMNVECKKMNRQEESKLYRIINFVLASRRKGLQTILSSGKNGV